MCPDVRFHRMSFRYTKADCDRFRSYIAEAPLPVFFKHTTPKIAVLISERIFSGMESFIAQQWFQQKPKSRQPCYTRACAVFIAQCNYNSNIYRREQCRRRLTTFKTACNHCKRVLENILSICAQAVQAECNRTTPSPVVQNFQQWGWKVTCFFIIKC